MCVDNSLEVSQKCKNGYDVAQEVLACLKRGMKNLLVHMNLYVSIHSSIVIAQGKTTHVPTLLN